MISNTCLIATLSLTAMSALVMAGDNYAFDGLPFNTENTPWVAGQRVHFDYHPKDFATFDLSKHKVVISQQGGSRFSVWPQGEVKHECANVKEENPQTPNTISISCDLSKDYNDDNKKFYITIEKKEGKSKPVHSLPFFVKLAGKSTTEQVKENAQETAEKTGEKAKSVGENVADSAKETYDNAKDKVDSAADSAKETYDNAKDKVDSAAEQTTDKLNELKKETLDNGVVKGHEDKEVDPHYIDTPKDTPKETPKEKAVEITIEEGVPTKVEVVDDHNTANTLSINALLSFTCLGIATVFTLMF